MFILLLAFGIGSMIYSGLEFGQYFELEPATKCHNVLLVLTPATRMAFIFIQMYFIFLNDEVRFKSLKRIRNKYKLVILYSIVGDTKLFKFVKFLDNCTDKIKILNRYSYNNKPIHYFHLVVFIRSTYLLHVTCNIHTTT